MKKIVFAMGARLGLSKLVGRRKYGNLRVGHSYAGEGIIVKVRRDVLGEQ